MLFADDCVLRIAVLDQAAHRSLGIAVSQRYRARIALQQDRCVAQKERADRGERYRNQFVHERHELALLSARQRSAVAPGHLRAFRPEQRFAGGAVRSVCC